MLMLDTCVCIDFLRGRMPEGLAIMKRADPAGIKIPAIVAAELFLGALKSAKPSQNRANIELFLAPFECIPFDPAAAECYACIRADVEQQGKPVGPNDLIIAATALSREATLVTTNEREFGRIKGLAVEVWADTTV